MPDYPLNQLYFYLTRGCNLHCRHCWITPQFQAEGRSYPSLEVDVFRSILEQAKPLGLSGVKLTGGEPLIHPRIHEIIEIVGNEDLALVVETNGVACTPELAAAMKACKEAFVSVSIDAAEPEIHEWMRGVQGCFDAAVQGVRNLVAAGFRPQIIMSVARRNKDQIEAVVRMAEELECGSVKFNLVQPTARGEKMHEAGETLPIEELVELGQWVETELAASSNILVVYSHPAAFRPLSNMFGRHGDGCYSCGVFGILGVLADGSYALCGIGETVPEFVVGSGQKDSLADVWNDAPLLKEIRAGLPDRLTGICRDCLMKRICLGDCIAQNYYRSKNLWAPYWYCEAAAEKGLFPRTRGA